MGERSGRGKRDRNGGGDGILVKDPAGALESFGSSTACREFALGGSAVVRLKEDAFMFADACIIDVESSEAADVTGDVVEKVKFEST